VSLPDRSASNSLSLRGASALAPALKKVAKAVSVVAALVYAYTVAGGVVYQSNAYPFVVAARGKNTPQRTPTLHGSDRGI
jgi:hypothetical protein